MNFEECVSKINERKDDVQKMSETDVLKLYGLYKQSTVGDINIDCPSVFNFKETKKWYAWDNFKGLDKKIAKQLYCDMVNYFC